MSKLRTAVLLVGLGGALACGQGGDDTAPDSPPPGPLPITNAAPVPPSTSLKCDKSTSLTYENFGAAFARTYCTSCHASSLTGADRRGAPAAVNLDTALGLKTWRGRVLARAGGKDATMPPSGNVSADDRAALSEWLGCGAPSAQ